MAEINNCEFMVRGYYYVKVTSPSRVDSCKLCIDETMAGEESSVDPESETWIVPTTATVDSTNVLRIKGIHQFNVATPVNPYAIARIRKGYIDDENGTLITNSDGYLTYVVGTGISIT